MIIFSVTSGAKVGFTFLEFLVLSSEQFKPSPPKLIEKSRGDIF